jgi:hypothetical protein
MSMSKLERGVKWGGRGGKREGQRVKTRKSRRGMGSGEWTRK